MMRIPDRVRGPEAVLRACRHGKLLWLGPLLTLTAVFGADPAMANANLLERSPRQECHGSVPACQSSGGSLQSVPRDSEREITLACPAGAPFFWNWAAEPSPHVQVYFIAPVQDNKHRAVGARFTLSQQSDYERGYARVFLGCSAQLPSRKHPQTMFYTSTGWNQSQ